jgi:hypothetical protein
MLDLPYPRSAATLWPVDYPSFRSRSYQMLLAEKVRYPASMVFARYWAGFVRCASYPRTLKSAMASQPCGPEICKLVLYTVALQFVRRPLNLYS